MKKTEIIGVTSQNTLPPKMSRKNPWFAAHFSFQKKTMKFLAKISVFFSYLLDIAGEKMYNKIV